MIVVATGYSFCDPDQYLGTVCWNNLALASSTRDGYSVDGDSGGPWFALAGSDQATVSARGVHHGIEFLGPGYVEAFTPITVLTADLGISANT